MEYVAFDDRGAFFQPERLDARLRLAAKVGNYFHANRARAVFLRRLNDDAPVAAAQVVDHVAGLDVRQPRLFSQTRRGSGDGGPRVFGGKFLSKTQSRYRSGEQRNR